MSKAVSRNPKARPRFSWAFSHSGFHQKNKQQRNENHDHDCQVEVLTVHSPGAYSGAIVYRTDLSILTVWSGSALKAAVDVAVFLLVDSRQRNAGPMPSYLLATETHSFSASL
jgi:hypothetical protein